MLYFAYGSNMDWTQMQTRCPQAQFLFNATLPGYQLEFTHQRINNRGGAADAVERQGRTVWGVVYHLEDSDLPGLHQAEGYQPGRDRNSYVPVTVVVLPDFERPSLLRVVTFTVRRKLEGHQHPSREYLDRILAGAKHWNLQTDYQAMLEKIETRQ